MQKYSTGMHAQGIQDIKLHLCLVPAQSAMMWCATTRSQIQEGTTARFFPERHYEALRDKPRWAWPI